MSVAPEDVPEELLSEERQQATEHAAAQEEGPEPLVKVMITPTTCGVMKFENGQRLITMTQQGIELSIPLGPNEAQQLSEELHVSKVQTSTAAEAKAAGIILPS